MQADGTRIIFNKNPGTPTSLCASQQPGNGIVKIFETEGTQQANANSRHFVWRWMDGRELRFNHQGRLTTIGCPAANRCACATTPRARGCCRSPPRKAAACTCATRSQARHGERTLVQAMDSPVGRIEYRHGSAPLPGSAQPADKLRASLVQVRLPSPLPSAPSEASAQDPIQRHDHYEDPRHPSLLTGISVQGRGSDGQPLNERIASYAYAASGQVQTISDLIARYRYNSQGQRVGKTVFRGGSEHHSRPPGRGNRTARQLAPQL